MILINLIFCVAGLTAETEFTGFLSRLEELKLPEQTEGGFGNFSANVLYSEYCSGAKPKNATDVNVVFTTDGTNLLYGNVTVLEDTGQMRTIINIYKINNYKESLVIPIRFNRLCFEEFAKDFISQFMPITDKCGLVKGQYYVNATDINIAAHGLIGDRNYFGRYITKILVYTVKMNIVCLMVAADFVPAKPAHH